MTTLRALAVLTAVGLAPSATALAASGESSHTVLLSAASLIRLRSATRALVELGQKTPTAIEDVPFLGQAGLDLTAATSALAEHEAVRDTVTHAGFKPRDFLATLWSFNDAVASRQLMRRAGHPPPAGELATNQRTLAENPSDVRDILRNLQKLSLLQQH
jgi:hypothetical protein